MIYDPVVDADAPSLRRNYSAPVEDPTAAGATGWFSAVLRPGEAAFIFILQPFLVTARRCVAL